MTWFRVDDTLAAHPKARKAGLPAMGLWVVAGSWSSQQLTEGFVPEWFVDTWPQGRKHAAQLTASGLWERVDDEEPGWLFHEWTVCNPTADKERERKDRARERQRKAREKASAKRDQQRDKAVSDARESQDTSRVTNGVSHAPPYPTPPDPTRPLPTEGDGDQWMTSGGNVQQVDARGPQRPPRFPDHCPQHADDPVPPDCGRCMETRTRRAETPEALPDYRLRVVPPLCGECDERWIETPDGWAKCPRCYPQEVSA